MESLTDRIKPKAKMVGEDGNIFSLMGIARRALRQAGQGDLVSEMIEKVTSCKSYDDALIALMDYVEIE